MGSMAEWIVALGMYLIFMLAVVVAYYVVYALAHMKALNTLGYDKAWLAWIPFVNYYAYAEETSDNQETVNLFGTLSVPVVVYKFWWVGMIIIYFIPGVGAFLATVLRVVFLGTCYQKMYAKLECTSEQEQQAIGYISGFIPLVAVVKFLSGKYK